MAEKKEKSARVLSVEKYDKKTARPMSLKFNANTDKRLLSYFALLASKQGYIKELVDNDLENFKTGKPSVIVNYIKKEKREEAEALKEKEW